MIIDKTVLNIQSGILELVGLQIVGTHQQHGNSDLRTNPGGHPGPPGASGHQRSTIALFNKLDRCHVELVKRLLAGLSERDCRQTDANNEEKPANPNLLPSETKLEHKSINSRDFSLTHSAFSNYSRRFWAAWHEVRLAGMPDRTISRKPAPARSKAAS